MASDEIQHRGSAMVAARSSACVRVWTSACIWPGIPGSTSNLASNAAGAAVRRQRCVACTRLCEYSVAVCVSEGLQLQLQLVAGSQAGGCVAWTAGGCAATAYSTCTWQACRCAPMCTLLPTSVYRYRYCVLKAQASCSRVLALRCHVHVKVVEWAGPLERGFWQAQTPP